MDIRTNDVTIAQSTDRSIYFDSHFIATTKDSNMESFLKKYTKFMIKLYTGLNISFHKVATLLQETKTLHAGGSVSDIMLVNRKSVCENF